MNVKEKLIAKNIFSDIEERVRRVVKKGECYFLCGKILKEQGKKSNVLIAAKINFSETEEEAELPIVKIVENLFKEETEIAMSGVQKIVLLK